MGKPSLLTVEVTTDGAGWRRAWRGRAAGAVKVIHAAQGALESRPLPAGVIDILFTVNSRMCALNSQFRGKMSATNVLSFPNPARPFGALALGLEIIEAEALAQGKPFEDHCKHLILHGFLHLLGYDHQTVTERRLMERLETAILATMGIPTPYLLRT